MTDTLVMQVKACVKDCGMLAGAPSTAKALKVYGYKYLAAGAYGSVIAHPLDPHKVIKIGMNIKDGWPTYATYCLVHGMENQHLLKVFSLHLFDGMYVAEIERLQDCRDDYEFIEQRMELQQRQSGPLVNLWNTVGHYTDLHNGNFMRRGKTLVVTDPYSNMTFKGEYPEAYTPEYGTGKILANDVLDRLVAIKDERTKTPVVENSRDVAPKAFAEDIALRINEFHDGGEFAKRMAGILPQVRIIRVYETHFDALVNSIINAARQGHDYVQDAYGLRIRIRGHELDIIGSPNVVFEGRDWRWLESRLQARVQRIIRPRRATGIEQDRGAFGHYNSKAGWGRQGAEIPHPRGERRLHDFPVYKREPINWHMHNMQLQAFAMQADFGDIERRIHEHFKFGPNLYLGTEDHGPIIGKRGDLIIMDDPEPQMEPDSNGGCTEHYKGRTIPAKCQSSRDVLRREADATARPQSRVRSNRNMAGPRPCGGQGNRQAGKSAGAAWYRVWIDKVHERPKEPLG